MEHITYCTYTFSFSIQICDNTNQARGFSAIGIGSGLGRLIVSIMNLSSVPHSHVAYS